MLPEGGIYKRKATAEDTKPEHEFVKVLLPDIGVQRELHLTEQTGAVTEKICLALQDGNEVSGRVKQTPEHYQNSFFLAVFMAKT